MPGLGTVLRWKGALVNGEHWLFEAWPAPLEVLVRTAMVTAGAKRRSMLRRQLRRTQKHRTRKVDGPVDALVAQPHRRLISEPSAQMTADLLRTPPLGQQLTDQLTQLQIGLDAASMMPGAAR